MAMRNYFLIGPPVGLFVTLASILYAQNFLDPIKTGNNTGKLSKAWQSNDAGSANLNLTSDGLKFTINSRWDRYLDAAHPSAKALALMVFSAKTATGDLAIGFAPHPG